MIIFPKHCDISDKIMRLGPSPALNRPSLKLFSPRTWIFLLLLSTNSIQPSWAEKNVDNIEIVVSTPYQMNGVSVAKDGRIFVGMPRWVDQRSFSVGIVQQGKIMPYPGGEWNKWKPGLPPQEHFININALRIENADQNTLWAVDCASGIPNGAKLVKMDLNNNTVSRVYTFDASIVPAQKGCLNDVRVKDKTAFLTESGTGAIIVVDLDSGAARRLLAESSKTKAVEGEVAEIDGRKEITPDGQIPIVNADGIELSPDQKWLYFCMPMGGPLWRVPVNALIQTDLSPKQLDQKVEKVTDLIPVGGILMLPSGNMLLSDVENHAIQLLDQRGKLHLVTQSALLDWPDAMALGSDDWVYTSAAQANRVPSNNHGIDGTHSPFNLLRFKLAENIR